MLRLLALAILVYFFSLACLVLLRFSEFCLVLLGVVEPKVMWILLYVI